MLTTSEQINEIAGALAKAQGEMENATKNAANPHFKSRYADLGEILNVARPALARHGIALSQMPSYEDGRVTVDTMLAHSSGQWMRGTCGAAVGKGDPQAIGSATTYLRRYSLAAMCGIAQEDDDGEATRGEQQDKRERRPKPPPAANPLDALASKVRGMVADIRALDAAAGAAASAEAEAAISDPNANEVSIRRVGGTLLKRLRALQADAEAAAVDAALEQDAGA